LILVYYYSFLIPSFRFQVYYYFEEKKTTTKTKH
jgi:hypothetical protein